MGTLAGTVAELRRYPVKSMLGEALAAAPVGAGGVAGDRAYALVDEETGKVVSVKRPARWGRMFELAAATGEGGVGVRLPDGRIVDVEDGRLASELSAVFGRQVSIATAPPPDASFDESWVPDLKGGVAPYFDLPSRDEGDEQHLVDAGQFMSANGSFQNFGAVHLVTTATTRRLGELSPGTRFDAHRFRPNVVIDTDDDGFVETAWQGRTLRVGDVVLQVSFTVPRCVMTTLEQGDLPADRDVLRTIAAHNAVDCFGTGTAYPCVGVYADVVQGGVLEVGQQAVLE